MDTIIYHTTQDHCYFLIRMNYYTAGHGKSNLAYNNVEDIDMPIVFVSIVSTL